MQNRAKIQRPLFEYLILTAIFFLLVAILPANTSVMQDYGLSTHQYHILLFLVELPLAAVWFAAFFGYARLSQYAASVSNTAEGRGYEKLARGFKWLAFGLVIPSIVSLIVNAIADKHPNFHATAIITSNYLTVFFALVAFSIISNASRTLNHYKKQPDGLVSNKSILLLFVTLAVAFCYLIFRHVAIAAGITSSDNPYYLPIWLLMVTLVIPFLYAWFVGLLAAYDLGQLAKHSKGVLYKQAVHLLAGGVSIVIASLIAIQFLRSVIPRTGHVSLNLVLVTIYLIYIVNVIGFAMISVSASRLKRIEDI